LPPELTEAEQVRADDKEEGVEAEQQERERERGEDRRKRKRGGLKGGLIITCHSRHQNLPAKSSDGQI
jgi:hypothetical protein